MLTMSIPSACPPAPTSPSSPSPPSYMRTYTRAQEAFRARPAHVRPHGQACRGGGVAGRCPERPDGRRLACRRLAVEAPRGGQGLLHGIGAHGSGTTTQPFLFDLRGLLVVVVVMVMEEVEAKVVSFTTLLLFLFLLLVLVLVLVLLYCGAGLPLRKWNIEDQARAWGGQPKKTEKKSFSHFDSKSPAAGVVAPPASTCTGKKNHPTAKPVYRI